MEAIYTDQSQCDYFNVPYFGDGELVVAADTLLTSKRNGGYDEQHTAFLSSFGEKTLVLERGENDKIGPGWWRLKEVL
jgi:hypothetical protein